MARELVRVFKEGRVGEETVEPDGVPWKSLNLSFFKKIYKFLATSGAAPLKLKITIMTIMALNFELIFLFFFILLGRARVSGCHSVMTLIFGRGA